MYPLPFYVVPLTHPTWEEALTCAKRLPGDALPELRLDLFPEEDPAAMVDALRRRCLVTCRRALEYGRWEGPEAERQAHLMRAVASRPQWLDWEWDLEVPPELEAHRTHTRLLRSVHVRPGTFDLEARLRDLPSGEAWKWVGHAGRLADNAHLKPLLGWARDRKVQLSAFLMGPKGIVSRCLQAAWGGAFTYAAPDDGPPAAPGQVRLSDMRAWRCAKLHPDYGLCGVLGSPVAHSRGPAFHNPRFQRAFKDLLYLPLDAGSAEEAVEALDALEILGASVTAPLKESLPAALGLEGPLNTLWRRVPGAPWGSANTDAEALAEGIQALDPSPGATVLLLGSGGVAATSREVLEAAGLKVLQLSRSTPLIHSAASAAEGVVQATSLGMAPGDPMPFPEHLAAAEGLRWAVEWVYKEDTAFAAWARERGLRLLEGARLFEAQAEAQSRRFITGCGGE